MIQNSSTKLQTSQVPRIAWGKIIQKFLSNPPTPDSLEFSHFSILAEVPRIAHCSNSHLQPMHHGFLSSCRVSNQD
ncbi:hypothetical protein I7I50_05339 [Histoplasma capsulatum G186AR]|uniref:Uncharacterized protein n=1 Tax=Ajellomyces capsulatus TaxID=5037 RepID=A0A8H8D7P3_AJECA|nr:hypothetical protein I7I52_03600 [Histoplasma capsulatum]QSS76019.1 hypothetical protein I7I50_05339 [Histoplasma capsulatum G186AR]